MLTKVVNMIVFKLKHYEVYTSRFGGFDVARRFKGKILGEFYKHFGSLNEAIDFVKSEVFLDEQDKAN